LTNDRIGFQGKGKEGKGKEGKGKEGKGKGMGPPAAGGEEGKLNPSFY
jgi:hypothetical protein